MARITPCLGFGSEAEEAANFYVSLLPDSKHLGGPDKAGPQRAMQARLGMVKLDIEGLRRADGCPAFAGHGGQ